jgi:hypothetical protein
MWRPWSKAPAAAWRYENRDARHAARPTTQAQGEPAIWAAVEGQEAGPRAEDSGGRHLIRPVDRLEIGIVVPEFGLCRRPPPGLPAAYLLRTRIAAQTGSAEQEPEAS